MRRVLCPQESPGGTVNREHMLSGTFAQIAETVSLLLLVAGIVCLCQPFALSLFGHGFSLLLVGWLGLTVFSHRKPVA